MTSGLSTDQILTCWYVIQLYVNTERALDLLLTDTKRYGIWDSAYSGHIADLARTAEEDTYRGMRRGLPYGLKLDK
jgi:hypothetical protein